MSNTAAIAARLSQAVTLHRAGRLMEAEAGYRAVLTTNPDNADALHLLGLVRQSQGAVDEALELIERSLKTGPRNAAAHFNKANLLAQLGRAADAVKAYRKAIDLRPGDADPRLNLGVLLYHEGDLQGAAQAFRAMVAKVPADPRGYYNLGKVLAEMGEAPDAEAALRKALALKPGDTECLITLAKLFADTGRLTDAIDTGRAAVAGAPENATAAANLGSYLADADAHAAALEMYDRALAVDPEHAGARVNRALSHLVHGRFAQGWEGYGARAQSEGGFKFLKLDLPWPRWAGEALEGKRIFIWNEQGLGDEILHAGMLGDLLASGAQCVVGCAARLLTLLRRSFPSIIFEPLEDVLADVTRWRFDYHVASFDIGRWLRSSFQAFPNRAAYLRADDEAVRRLRARYQAAAPGKLLVGLSWRSRAPHVGGLKTPLTDVWAPLFERRDVQLVSVQYGPAVEIENDIARFHERFGAAPLIDSHVDHAGALDDSAAQIGAVDLVVSVSNTAAHLGGSLGVPSWIVVPTGKARLWYWFKDGAYNPWYRSVRCVRWDGVDRNPLRKVVEGLSRT